MYWMDSKEGKELMNNNFLVNYKYLQCIQCIMSKDKVISIRISDEVYDLWKEALALERKKIKSLFTDENAVTLNEAPLIESLMTDWANRTLNKQNE